MKEKTSLWRLQMYQELKIHNPQQIICQLKHAYWNNNDENKKIKLNRHITEKSQLCQKWVNKSITFYTNNVQEYNV